jgi:hypothetical protein
MLNLNNTEVLDTEYYYHFLIFDFVLIKQNYNIRRLLQNSLEF